MSAPGWQHGSRVGEYVLSDTLGQGGMGKVYVAQHTETGTRYALKTVHPDASPDVIARFRREGEAQARVGSHPNVVRVRTAGEWQGRLYLVMDLASGGDLGRRLRHGPLSADEAAQLVAALARGLAHVHACGVLHRDLKPENVLFDEAGVPKLVDFGVARLKGSDFLTRTGTSLGTPAYMAPEQVDSHRHQIGAPTDVYGLGAVLYHCLAGKPPFSGGVESVMRQVLMRAPARPSELSPGLPKELEAICLKALAKSPRERYPTAASLAEALESYLRGDAQALAAGPRRRWAILALVLGPLLAAALYILLSGKEGGPPEYPLASVRPTPAASPPASPLPTPSAVEEDPGGLKRGEKRGEWINPADGSTLVRVEAATFSMGAKPDDFPPGYPLYDPLRYQIHEVTVSKPFYIGKLEVTWEQFKAFCEARGLTPPRNILRSKGSAYTPKPGWPVFNVTHREAQAYCEWAGLRLPTEAEWELAARGTEQNKFPWGNTAIDIQGERYYANLTSALEEVVPGMNDSFDTLAPVGSFPQGASPCGALDMAGNVWEWVADPYGHYPAEAVTDPWGSTPPGAPVRHVLRGGEWDHGFVECATFYREVVPPRLHRDDTGFRVARDVD